MNYQNDMEDNGETTILSSREVSLALLFQLPDCEKERRMTATSGLKCLELYEMFNPNGSSLKTFLDCLLKSEAWYSRACVLTWKPKVTPFNRLLFQLVPSMRRTAGTGFSLLPTVQTQGLKACNAEGKTEFVDLKLLPTPTASCKESGTNIISEKHDRSTSLNHLMAQLLLPTPQASDGFKTTKESNQINLNKSFQTGGTFQLNPLFVAEMMSFPPDWLTSPFQGGDGNQ